LSARDAQPLAEQRVSDTIPCLDRDLARSIATLHREAKHLHKKSRSIQMDDQVDLRPYVQVLIDRWMWIAAGALIAAATALAVSFLIPPTYEATALVAVTESLHTLRFDPRLETTYELELGLRAYPELATSDELLQELWEQLEPTSAGPQNVRELHDSLEAAPGPDLSIVRLTTRSQDPDQAAHIVNSWAELFVGFAEEAYFGHGAQVSFFESQLEQARVELEDTEQALVAFQTRNQAAIIGAQLSSAQQDLQDYLIEERATARLIRDARALQTSLAELQPDSPADPGDVLTTLLLQMQAFSVRTSRAFETGLEAGSPIQLEISELEIISSERTVGQLVTLLDDLVTILEDKQEEIVAQGEALEPQILTLQQSLQEALSEHGQLNLARDVAYETVQTLARKVEEASIAAEDSGGAIRLASRASVPEEPVSPRKLINTLAAGAVGLLAGVSGAFLVAWWRENGESQRT
jgi:uncharacterized protein involved in exopolysaccharide biosynthesis